MNRLSAPLCVLIICSVQCALLGDELVEAVYRNDLAAVQTLLRQGANPNKISSGVTPLVIAAEWGYDEMIKALLSHGAKPDTVDLEGRTPLIWAIGNENIGAAQLLLQAHADPSWVDNHGESVLGQAVQNNDSDAMKLLLPFGAKPGPAEIKSLRAAIDHHNEEMLHTLLEAGVNPCIKTENERSVFCDAVGEDSANFIKMLVEKSDGCDDPAYFLADALYCAAWDGKLEPIKYIISVIRKRRLKPQVGKTNNFYNETTLLQIIDSAISQKHPETAKYLIEALPEIGREGRGALLVQALRTNQNDVFQSLLDHGAAIDVAPPSETTPLIQACINGDLDRARFFLEHGASLKKKSYAFETPLSAACRSGNLTLVELLLKHGATFQEGNFAKSGILIAAADDHIKADVCAALVAHGCNVNATNDRGWTVLHFAADRNDVDLVKTLLSLKAKTTVKDRMGKTARDYAEERGATEIVQLLSASQSSSGYDEKR